MSFAASRDVFQACLITKDGHHKSPGPSGEQARTCKEAIESLQSQRAVGAPHQLPAAFKAHEFREGGGRVGR